MVVSCNRNASAPPQKVVLYTSVDEPYVRPLIDQFQKETGIEVTLLTDAEASKSVGLAEKLRAEKDHPSADVWWDNECFLTIRLGQEGVLAPYDSPAAADIPDKFKDAGHLWAGSILRVRVMISSPKISQSKPTRLEDLLRPDLKGQVVLARPTAGTTGGHVAALSLIMKPPQADQFFKGLHDNGATMVGGNSVAAESVARGEMLAGLCDNDDAASAIAEGLKLDVTLPDQGPSERGTLAIPCVVSLVAGAPHPDAAKKLIDYLLSANTDRALIDAKFAWCSTRDMAGKGKFMDVDYEAVAAAMPTAIRQATAEIEGR
ncbi:MAG TPA: extracellular solute-binding protein [Tepidisphaeraceae bacterium]|nr:extracellular solute-binding protein [Tepidisphaeraceae bacterium]